MSFELLAFCCNCHITETLVSSQAVKSLDKLLAMLYMCGICCHGPREGRHVGTIRKSVSLFLLSLLSIVFEIETFPLPSLPLRSNMAAVSQPMTGDPTEHRQELIERLDALRRNESFCDVTFAVKAQEFKPVLPFTSRKHERRQQTTDQNRA